MNAPQIPLILLSGMGADERVFHPQAAAFEHLTVPKWVEPERSEPLPDYARRMAAAVDPGRPCFLGGASFGGMVAMEMVQHLDVKAVFLIGSARGPEGLPLVARLFRPVGFVVQWLPLELFLFGGKVVRTLFGRWMPPYVQILFQQLESSDASFLRWAIFALLRWKGVAVGSGVPVYQIHGDRDRPLPIRYANPTTVVQGGGHVISLSHKDEVTAFLRSHMSEQS